MADEGHTADLVRTLRKEADVLRARIHVLEKQVKGLGAENQGLKLTIALLAELKEREEQGKS